jgi:CubicO group peptidase (beta-lactamase class C family)
VHDENSWAFSGYGAAGHAGLFGTAECVLKLGTAMLDSLAGRSSLLPRDAAQRLVRPRAGGSLLCGFDGKSATSPSAGPSSSERSFGHLGFTGTSLWCDPDSEVVTVLLTNRVCPTRNNSRIRAARPVVHERLFQLGCDHISLEVPT